MSSYSDLKIDIHWCIQTAFKPSFWHFESSTEGWTYFWKNNFIFMWIQYIQVTKFYGNHCHGFLWAVKFIYSEKATRWRFCKILWPSQNIWTLTRQGCCGKLASRFQVVKFSCWNNSTIVSWYVSHNFIRNRMLLQKVFNTIFV